MIDIRSALRERIDATLARLPMGDEKTRFLEQVAAVMEEMPDEVLRSDGAGFGSEVVVEDDEGNREAYTLMTGSVIDIDLKQVSLASPIGQALLGTHAGDRVVVEAPSGDRHLRVVTVRTLEDRLREIGATSVADADWNKPAVRV